MVSKETPKICKFYASLAFFLSNFPIVTVRVPNVGYKRFYDTQPLDEVG